MEQADGETDEQLITGGWLVEFDNVLDNNQLRMSVQGTNLPYLLVTYHSPEVLSTMQRTFLRSQMQTIVNTVFQEDKSSTDWEKLIDLPTLARYYLVSEIIDNPETFLGSCYLHKDRGEEKWKFGPVWDFGHAFSDWHPKNEFFYNYDNGWYPGLINEIVKFPRFQAEVQRLWHEYYPSMYMGLRSYLQWYAAHIREAARCDTQRWQNQTDIDESVAQCLNMLEQKKNFLNSQWQRSTGVGVVATTASSEAPPLLHSLTGQRLSQAPQHGLYIKDNKKYLK